MTNGRLTTRESEKIGRWSKNKRQKNEKKDDSIKEIKKT